MSTLRPPWAVLFDLDGTLVDTVAIRVQAWLEVFGQAGIAADPEHVGDLMGSDGKHVAFEVAGAAQRVSTEREAADIDREAGARFGELNVTPRALPGATELLEFLDAAGTPWGIAHVEPP